jgi:hypothetical protein
MALTASSPKSSSMAPLAIQTPERSGFPSAARGIGLPPGFGPVWAFTVVAHRTAVATTNASDLSMRVFTCDLSYFSL